MAMQNYGYTIDISMRSGLLQMKLSVFLV